MPKIRIPRSSPRYEARNHARLISYSGLSKPFLSGKLFKCGSEVDEAELWETSHYPVVPLLLEYAGNDHSGSGHNRSRDIFVLWRYLRDQRKWEEITRTLSHGSEWVYHLKPIVERELVRPAVDHVAEARAAVGHLAALIDGKLEELTPEGKEHAVALLYVDVTSRFSEYVEDKAAIYDAAEEPSAEVLEGEDVVSGSAGAIERISPGRALTSVEGLEAPAVSGAAIARIPPGRALGLESSGEDEMSGSDGQAAG